MKQSSSSSIRVQGTNDSSIVSKLSAENKNYFEDQFLKFFVKKNQKRSAIINRGYYIRFKAVEAGFKTWLQMLIPDSCTSSQIISFGAGFDTSYFRLKSKNLLPSHCRYIEIDFMETAQKKLDCINSYDDLTKYFTSIKKNGRYSEIVIWSSDYILLGIDLRNISMLQDFMHIIEVDFTGPTLFLSECAITYMDVNSSDNLLKWTQKSFLASVFCVYEQVYPDDGFGLIMQNHFSKLGSPLQSICAYPSVESQRSRFLAMNWKFCTVQNMNAFFNSLPSEERSRIQNLELFDEYEMWHQKCSHYVLILTSHKLLPQINVSEEKVYRLAEYNQLRNWTKINTSSFLHRYGHQTVLLPGGDFVISGGFGLLNQKHQKLKGIAIGNYETGNAFELKLRDPDNLLKERMHHSMVILNDGTIALVGGRSAPSNPYNEILLLMADNCELESKITDDMSNSFKISMQNVSSISVSVSQKGLFPFPKWRHSATVIGINGIEYIVTFGGCSRTKKATNDCYILNTSTWKWTEVPLQKETPVARHSHSSSANNDARQIIISGGLTEDESPLNTVHVLDCISLTWSHLSVEGLLKRYSHTSHIWKKKLILVGGVNDTPDFPPYLAVIDLEKLHATEYAIPAQDPEYPVLLYSHTSFIYEDKIIVIGGGGNCFSFGTHFNKHILIIDTLNL